MLSSSRPHDHATTSSFPLASSRLNVFCVPFCQICPLQCTTLWPQDLVQTCCVLGAFSVGSVCLHLQFYNTARQKGVELHLLCSIPQISITDLVHISRQRSHSHGMISVQTSASFRSSHHHCDPSVRVDGQSVGQSAFNLFLVITASESSSAVCMRNCNPFLIPFSHIKTHTLPQTANHAKTFRLRIELQNQ